MINENCPNVSQPSTQHTSYDKTEANHFELCENLLNFYSKPVSLRTDYSFSYSSHFHNKPPKNSKGDYTTFYSLIGSIDDLIAIVKSGKAVSSGVFRNSYRNKKNFIKTDLIILDVDNVIQDEEGNETYHPLLTIEHCTNDPFLSRFSMVSTSPSHTPHWHRLRLYFALPVTLTDELEIKTLIRYLNQYHLNGAIDLNAIDVSRMFYGNTNGEWYNTDFHVLPFELIDHCQNFASQEREIIEREKLERSKQASQTKHITTNHDIEVALTYISPDFSYDDWITVGFALYNYFSGSDEGFALFDNWSEGGHKYDGTDKLYRKWQSFSGDVEQPITISSLFKIAIEKGYKPSAHHTFYLDAENYQAFEQQKNLRKLSSEADYSFNSRYWNYDEFKQKLNHNANLLVLLGQKGTGKSYIIDHHENELIGTNYYKIPQKSLLNDYRNQGYNIIVISPRRALCEEQSERWNLAFINNSKNKYTTAIEMDDVSACIDSIAYFQDRNPDEKIVIVLDESETFVRHLLLSKTLKDKRGYIFKAFADLMMKIDNNDGKIILSDADASTSYDFINDFYTYITGSKLIPFIARNEYQYAPRKIKWFTDKSHLIDKVLEWVKEGKRLIMPIDSKEKGEAIAQLIREQNPEKKVVVINVDRIKDEYVRQFVVKPNNTFRQEKPDVVIYTGSMGMGVSIDVEGLFDYVVGIFSVLTPEQCRQMLWRYREQIPMMIYAESHNSRYKPEIPFDPLECLQREFSLMKRGTEIINMVTYLKDIKNDQELLNALSCLLDKDLNIYVDPISKYSAMVMAMDNYAFKYYSMFLKYELEEVEGNEIEIIMPSENKSNSDKEVENIQQENTIKFAHAVAEGENIPLEMAQMLSQKEIISKEQEKAVTKAFLKAEFPEIPITKEFCEFIYKDGRRTVNAVKFDFYRLNPEITKEHDRKNWSNFLKNNNCFAHTYDVKQFYGATKLIDSFYLDELFEAVNNADNPILSNKHEVIQKIRKRALRVKDKLKLYFGLNITPKMNTIKFLQSLLAKIGYKLTKDKGKNKPFHIEDMTGEWRSPIHHSLLLKYENLVTNKDEDYKNNGTTENSENGSEKLDINLTEYETNHGGDSSFYTKKESLVTPPASVVLAKVNPKMPVEEESVVNKEEYYEKSEPNFNQKMVCKESKESNEGQGIKPNCESPLNTKKEILVISPTNVVMNISVTKKTQPVNKEQCCPQSE